MRYDGKIALGKMTFTPSEADQIIESFRIGIPPPDGFVRYFTVGCENEIAFLKEQLSHQNVTALLVNANPGSGRTHLLKFIREEALEQNYAVSLVTLDAKNDTPFYKIDLIFDTICRNIEIPPNVKENDTSKGIRSLFDLIEGKLPKSKNDLEDVMITLNAIVGYTDFGLPIFSKDFKIRSSISQVEAFLSRKTSGKKNYDTSWRLLSDLNDLAHFAGLKGLVILFDKFEDILTNITRIEDQTQCFVNLSQFCSGKYSAKTFYAVTPEFVDKWPAFVNKCAARFKMKDEDYIFETCCSEINNNLRLFPKFPPLEKSSLVKMGRKIVTTHGIAYNWDTSKYANDEIVSRWLNKSASIKITDRTRQSVKLIVSKLDNCRDYNDFKPN